MHLPRREEIQREDHQLSFAEYCIVLLVVKIVKSISIVVAPLVERLIIFAVLLVKVAVLLCR